MTSKPKHQCSYQVCQCSENCCSNIIIKIFSVPQPAGGVIVVGQETIAYYNEDYQKSVAPPELVVRALSKDLQLHSAKIQSTILC